MKLAAIDIGSNAARLLITEVEENGKGNPSFNKLNLVRVPLRLGFDVFETGEISKIKINKVVETINNTFRKQEVTKCFIKALPNIAEILIAESENPPTINKHELVAAYAIYSNNFTQTLAITLNEFEHTYQQLHN